MTMSSIDFEHCRHGFGHEDDDRVSARHRPLVGHAGGYAEEKRCGVTVIGRESSLSDPELQSPVNVSYS